jgi:pimeloyl-ACP methyl ester carboxylesterase
MSDGTRIYFEEHGAGEPLLLVSGQGSDHHGWDTLVDRFAAQYRCITWDHRGTGESDKPREPAYSIEGFAADAIALLDHLGIARAHAYGISMGGRVCQRLAIAYPGRLGAVVLGCTTPGNAHGVRRPPDVDAAMTNRPTDPEERLRFMAQNLVSPEWMAAHPAWVDAMRERFQHPIPEYAQKLHYAASEGHEAWDELPSISNPVLVIHGDNDSINVTPNAYLLVGRIPGAELCIIRGGRHAFHVEFAGEAAEAVLGFLDRHPL